jgi:hypothetical protein
MTEDDGGSRPVPDPTVLTTAQLYREIAASQVSFEKDLTAIRDMSNTRFECARRLVEEKFASIDAQLELVERQRVEQKADTKAAVDAALTAQKEAVKEQTIAQGTAIAKSDAGTSEQLKAIRSEFSTALAGVLTTLNDIKDRVVAIESVRRGGQEATTESRSAGQYAISAALVVIAVVGLVVAVLLKK